MPWSSSVPVWRKQNEAEGKEVLQKNLTVTPVCGHLDHLWLSLSLSLSLSLHSDISSNKKKRKEKRTNILMHQRCYLCYIRILIVAEIMGTVPKTPEQEAGELEIRGRLQSILIIALLKSDWILGRDLMT